MYAASASDFCGPRDRHHHHRHGRGGRGLDELIAFMTSGGRGGPPWADPRMFKAMFWGGPGGPGGHRGGPHGGRRGGRARRGDVRAALLLLIEGGPQNGYQLIQEIERRTDGFWKPSPGS